jgi:hypothetical protein
LKRVLQLLSVFLEAQNDHVAVCQGQLAKVKEKKAGCLMKLNDWMLLFAKT